MWAEIQQRRVELSLILILSTFVIFAYLAIAAAVAA